MEFYTISKKEFPNVRGGFIHVPYAVSQVVNKPATLSMAIADITAALETAVKAAVEYEQDIKVVGGETLKVTSVAQKLHLRKFSGCNTSLKTPRMKFFFIRFGLPFEAPARNPVF